MTVPIHPKERPDWWVILAIVLLAIQIATLIALYSRLGPVTLTLFYFTHGINICLAWALLLAAVIWSIWKRPFLRKSRLVGGGALALILLTPNVAATYPSSHDNSPSKVAFRLPWDGPITVGHGGATESVNYHVSAPDQRWAYDLFVTQDGKPHRGDGKKLTDYYCYGKPVLASAGGIVRRVDDGHPEAAPEQMGGTPAGGNEVVLEVAPKEFLFLCHMQPHSIRVKVGQKVRKGEVIGLSGNSGNTSMPHLHIHLQDSPLDEEGEGIPLEFHHYRSGNRIVEHGIPHGGENFEIVEHVL